MISVGDKVNVTLPHGVLIDYTVIEVPNKNEIYFTLAPTDTPLELTIVGPSLISMTKRLI